VARIGRALETRLVPTGVQYLNGVLTVTGDQAQANQADTLTVDLNPAAPQGHPQRVDDDARRRHPSPPST
jgi:hypothetical protein